MMISVILRSIVLSQGDVIQVVHRDNIDFRTNERLSRQCDFWAVVGSRLPVT